MIQTIKVLRVVASVGQHNCSSAMDGAKVEPPPDAIQLEFLREEHSIKGLEHNELFMLVGIIGGMAVVALATSIFWGLNGSSFVRKQPQ